jgi:hypothetical protein
MAKPEESRGEYGGLLVSDVVKREMEEKTGKYILSQGQSFFEMAILVSAEGSIRLSVGTRDHLEVIINQIIHRYAP